jgi:hypothetical protein
MWQDVACLCGNLQIGLNFGDKLVTNLQKMKILGILIIVTYQPES